MNMRAYVMAPNTSVCKINPQVVGHTIPLAPMEAVPPMRALVIRYVHAMDTK